MTLFVHVEEPSMETALGVLVPKILGDRGFKIINHGSKDRLLRDLPNRLAGYAAWADPSIRILVLIDRDDQDCQILKTRLEDMARQAGLPTKTHPAPDGFFRLVNRIVVEELEAWFFGDIPALATAYPGVPNNLGAKSAFRDPDAIKGGTWERLLKVLQEAGHYRGAEKLPKNDVAAKVAQSMTPALNRSASFRHFHQALLTL